MEGLSANVYKGLKGYWKTRHYKRLNNNNHNHHHHHNNNDPLERVEPRSEIDLNNVSRGKKRRFFRVKLTPRMRIWRRVVGMPKKWLTRLRDAYVKMMLNFANSGLVVGGGASGFGGSIQCGYGSGNYNNKNQNQIKEYDEKMIVEIYKSLMIAQGQIGAGGATKINSHHQHFRGSPKITISTR